MNKTHAKRPEQKLTQSRQGKKEEECKVLRLHHFLEGSPPRDPRRVADLQRFIRALGS
jgi:hypothetical protein